MCQTEQIILLCNYNNQNTTSKDELAKSAAVEKENIDIDIPRYVPDEPQETFSFNVNTAQMMSLIISAIYANRDVFLRELSTNANDVLDKSRDQLLTYIDGLGGVKQFKIKIVSKNENNGLKTRVLVLTRQVIFHITNNISMIGQFVLVLVAYYNTNTHNRKYKALLSRTCSL